MTQRTAQATEPVDVARVVRVELAARCIQRSTLATHLGMPRTSLYRKLRGDVEFTASEVSALAAFFDMPIESFFPASTESKQVAS